MKNILLIAFACIFFVSCDEPSKQESSSGVKKMNVKITTNPDGYTTEQENIAERLKNDNTPGSIKHFYLISAYSGQVLMYSTVRGKVTSSGKRLTPTTVQVTQGGQYSSRIEGYKFRAGGESFESSEFPQDDGTFGSSVEYLYWWDVRGIYHQHYITGGQVVHISDQPLPNVSSITLNLEVTK